MWTEIMKMDKKDVDKTIEWWRKENEKTTQKIR